MRTSLPRRNFCQGTPPSQALQAGTGDQGAAGEAAELELVGPGLTGLRRHCQRSSLQASDSSLMDVVCNLSFAVWVNQPSTPQRSHLGPAGSNPPYSTSEKTLRITKSTAAVSSLDFQSFCRKYYNGNQPSDLSENRILDAFWRLSIKEQQSRNSFYLIALIRDLFFLLFWDGARD